MKTILLASTALVVAFAVPAVAAGNKTGYTTTTVNTTGGSTKYNPNVSTSSTTTVTTSGPKGQLQTGGTTNVTSSKTNRPGSVIP